MSRAQARTPIQSLEEAKDAIQTIYVGSGEIISGSVDGHVRTYDLRKGQLTSDYLGRRFSHSQYKQPFSLLVDPITSIVPTKDNQTLLVTTLDGKIRLMDRKTGQALNTFQGHSHESYRCRACFDPTEEAVIFGDELGKVWAWDLVNVSRSNNLKY